tara:strand:- start:33598 stop:34515 length:918 start_codon:yes stop_codon:yes gene_type:complete
VEYLNHLQVFFGSLFSSEWQWSYVGINMLATLLLLIVFKYMIGIYSDVKMNEELAHKDNPAYGLITACSFLSFFLIMSAASTGEGVLSFAKEMGVVLGYGVAGMLMVLVSKVIFDKISLSKFCVREELSKRNMAVAIADGSNLVATSLIVFAYMSWVKSSSLTTISVVLFGWVLSQVLLSVLTWFRTAIFRAENGISLSESLQKNNIAVAIRFAGYRIAIALAPLITIGHYPYEDGWGFILAFEIFLTTILLAVIYLVGTFIAKKVIFNGVSFRSEINDQQNTGMAYIEFAFVLGLVFLNYGLLK